MGMGVGFVSFRLERGTHLGQAGQVDQRQAEDVRGVDFEVDGLSVDALVVSCYPGRLGLNLAPDLGEVVEPAPWNVQKLCPLLLARHAGGGVWHVDFVVVVGILALGGQVDELEDERSPCNDAVASGQKVSADNVLEHRRLSGRLRPYHDLQESACRHYELAVAPGCGGRRGGGGEGRGGERRGRSNAQSAGGQESHFQSC